MCVDSEVCQKCGASYLTVYRVSDDVWHVITGRINGGGLLCPCCCDELAREHGFCLYWEAGLHKFPTEKVIR